MFNEDSARQTDEKQVQQLSQFEVAAQWWADRLRDCVHNGLSPDERRDPQNFGYQIAEMLMTVGRPTITLEQVEAFKTALIAGLRDAKYPPYSIGVDYHPDELLSRALITADIPVANGVLPIKSHMALNDDGAVKVSYGYAAPQVVLREPDLLFAARRVLKQLDEAGTVALGDIKSLRDAIAKAEGRS